MISNISNGLNIHSLIERQAIETHFQPITSIRRKQIVGIEALSRGVDDNHQLIPPAELFKSAAEEKLSLELDYVCRTKALENFLPLHKVMPNLILFMNVHHAAFDLEGNNKDGLIAQVERFKLDPRNLAVEILESEFEDVALLRASIARYKQQGFLVALDDVGTGHSNLDRVTYIKPDIMKVDASLIQNIHLDYYKQEVFKSLVNLSEKIGGWIITEGVEEQAEAIVALELGGDFLQGFYLARPQKSDGENINCAWERVEETATKFKSQTLDKAKATESGRQTRAHCTGDQRAIRKGCGGRFLVLPLGNSQAVFVNRIRLCLERRGRANHRYDSQQNKIAKAKKHYLSAAGQRHGSLAERVLLRAARRTD